MNGVGRGGVCAICRRPSRARLDHCHATPRVRELCASASAERGRPISPATSVHAAAAKKAGATVPGVVRSTVIAAIEPIAPRSTINLRDRPRNGGNGSEAATGSVGKAGTMRKSRTGKAIGRSGEQASADTAAKRVFIIALLALLPPRSTKSSRLKASFIGFASIGPFLQSSDGRITTLLGARPAFRVGRFSARGTRPSPSSGGGPDGARPAP